MKGIVIFLDLNKNQIEKVSINNLTLRQEVIKEKSIEMFDDDDPCIIHQTWCTNKIGLEILENINNEYNKQDKINFNILEMPQYLSSKIILPKGTEYIEIR